MHTISLAANITFAFSSCLSVGRAQVDPYAYVAHSKQFGFEARRGRFQLVGGGGEPIESFLRIRYVEGSSSILLSKMEQLRGHASILNKRDALRFVRLRTAPDTFRLWRDGKLMTEIVDTADVLPVIELSFGLENVMFDEPGELFSDEAFWRYDAHTRIFVKLKPPNYGKALARSARPDVSKYGSGWNGFLSHTMFVKSGYSRPKVRRTSDGFVVERWLLVVNYRSDNPESTAALVRESVGADGAYSRKTLLAKPVGGFPGVGLCIPRLK